MREVHSGRWSQAASLVVTVIVTTALSACGDENRASRAVRDTGSARGQPMPNLLHSCLASDSAQRGLRYSDLQTSEETRDQSGVVVDLIRNGGAWLGSARIAKGELGPSRP